MTQIRPDTPSPLGMDDFEILGALQGIKEMQREIRQQRENACFVQFRRYYEQLPDEVARRLTEIDAGLVARLGGFPPGKSDVQPLIDGLASDAAFAQVIRAANVYRERLGFAPLGPDGWSAKQAGK